VSEIRFGGYRLTGTIGSGALSTIYRAVQEPLGRTVALKALKNQIAPTSSFGAQLDREAKILADLVHPNVVLLLEAGRTPSGRPYVVLEHVDGPSLLDVLEGKDAAKKSSGPVSSPSPPSSTQKTDRQRSAAEKKKKTPAALSVTSALAIACGACAALEHIHGKGIVHRDVKPSNLLISKAGVVKMIDFGIAQRPRTASMSDALGTEGITATGRMAPEQVKDAFGTPAYMSPEQILGDFVDGRSDLFSLGVVLYQMISGVRPFDGPVEEEKAGGGPRSAGAAKRSAAQRIRRDAPVALRERAPHCPRAVERIVMRLLEKSPNERYPSAGIVREKLEAALRSESREEPHALVRAALLQAGFAGGDEDSAKKLDSLRTAAAGTISTPEPTPAPPKPVKARAVRPSSSSSSSSRSTGGTVGAAMLGFLGITIAFGVAMIALEGTSAQAGNSAGSRPLELAPSNAGGLRVIATPWAHVRVDGQLVETTPFARAIPLSAGKHFVTLTHPDAISQIEREVVIKTGETMTLDVVMNLSPEDGGLQKDAGR
jgi:eukaryotic-like serine/threonine-protein kinase